MEIIVERWTDAVGKSDYLWSVWDRGRRVEMGGRFETAEAAQAAARQFCRDSLGEEPSRVRHL